MGYGSFTNYKNHENYILQKFPGIRLLEVRLPKAAQGYMRLKTGLHNSKLRAHMHYLKLRAHLHNSKLRVHLYSSKLRVHMQNSKLRDNTPLILIFLSLYSIWLFVHFGTPYVVTCILHLVIWGRRRH